MASDSNRLITAQPHYHAHYPYNLCYKLQQLHWLPTEARVGPYPTNCVVFPHVPN